MNAEIPPKTRYCLYARKSTESEEKQVLSIDSQIKEMLAIAEHEGLLVAEVRKECHSAKAVGQRPVFNELLSDIRAGKFGGILTWAPDRLSRNAGDLGALVDLMDQKLLVGIRTFNKKFSNSPSEKFMLMILCSQAKLENDNKSENVKRGMRARCEQGWRPAVSPTVYLNEKRKDRPCEAIIDPERAPVVRQMFEKVGNDGWSGRKLYHWLRYELGFKTKYGKHLALGNIYLILKNPYYHGIFEHPRGSGKWYKGKHVPIIDKELFEKVQAQLVRSEINNNNREFAFTKLITCGLCGSGITATEKFKEIKNGGTHRYVYYGCTKSKDKNCRCGYLREEEIIRQLAEMIGMLDLNELGVKNKFAAEIARYEKFQKIALGGNTKEVKGKFDLRAYATYLLTEGTITEKRELLANLKSRLMLKDKVLTISEILDSANASLE